MGTAKVRSHIITGEETMKSGDTVNLFGQPEPFDLNSTSGN
jgi:hypothetical protein